MDGTRFRPYNVAEIKRPVIPCIRTFKPCGKSGIPVSDIFPYVGNVIDEIAVVRSLWNHEGNHFPAVIETVTWTSRPGLRPFSSAVGGWVSYALGNALNKSLPYVCQHRPPFLASSTDGGIFGRQCGCHAVSARRTSDS